MLYRVTSIFERNNLVANGILLEEKSVENNEKGILFNVFIYKIQLWIDIDYKTAKSSLTKMSSKNNSTTYVLNTNTKVFHYDFCSSISKIKNSNKILTQIENFCFLKDIPLVKYVNNKKRIQENLVSFFIIYFK